MRKYGVQMCGLRDIAQSDMKLALKTAADIGYKYIEFAGFFDHPADEIRKYLDEYGLEVIGSHTTIDKLTEENIAKTIEYHTALGNKNITFPWIWGKDPEGLERSVATINFAQPILAEHGINLSVHNHYLEFTSGDFQSYSHSQIEKRTDIGFQLDTFWAFFAGKDPVELMEYYNSIGRLTSIHLKDGKKDHSTRALGEGEAPVREVLAKAIELDIPIIVESEGLNPNGAEENARCFEFLKKYGQ